MKSNLAARLLTAAIAVPILLWALFAAPRWVLPLLALGAALVASLELMQMTLGGHRRQRLWGVVATVAVFTAITIDPAPLTLMTLLAVLPIGALLLGLSQPDPIATSAPRVAWLATGPLYAGALLALIARLHQINPAWVLLSMMFAWFGDTGGYFAGRAWGHRKLYPKVSPKKTVEGSLGGLAGSAGGAVLAHYTYLPELPLVTGLGLAVIAGAAGQLGDLAESLIKRSQGRKDSGRLLPGHGGLLDRIDALLFTSAVTWMYVVWLH